MKTQKQLPNEFVFICDEHSREQLELLGVGYKGWGIESIPCEVKGFYFQINNNEILGGGFDGYEKQYDLSHAPLIFLSDYIEQKQNIITTTDDGSFRVPNNPSAILEFKTDGNRIPIEQKWQDRTRGGYEYVIYEEFEGQIFGRLNRGGEWLTITWNINGKYYQEINHSFDLLPADPHAQRKAEIKEQIEKLQKELEQLDK